jgi:hypothetical protein
VGVHILRRDSGQAVQEPQAELRSRVRVARRVVMGAVCRDVPVVRRNMAVECMEAMVTRPEELAERLPAARDIDIHSPMVQVELNLHRRPAGDHDFEMNRSLR